MSNRKHKNKSFAVHGKEQNHAKKENIRLPVAVRGSKTSVLKFLRTAPATRGLQDQKFEERIKCCEIDSHEEKVGSKTLDAVM